MAEKPAKKVIIDEIVFKGGLVKASFIFTGRVWEAVPTPLPPITLKGVGQDKGGVSSAEVFVQVIGAVLATVTGVIKGSANPLGEGVKRFGRRRSGGRKRRAGSRRDGGRGGVEGCRRGRRNDGARFGQGHQRPGRLAGRVEKKDE